MSSDPALLEADWPAPPGVRAITTLRHGVGISQAPFDTFNLGSRCGDAIESVAANRAALIERLQLPSPPCWLRQVHGTEVARFTEAEMAGATSSASLSAGTSRTSTQVTSSLHEQDSEPEADASATSEPGVVLAILTADCLPVVFAADDGSGVAAAHAGWRGLATGVLEATLAAMRTPPERVLAWLGPAAGPQAYEIGSEVRSAFVSRDAQADAAFAQTRPGHWRVDLYALARQRLAGAGVMRVHGGGLCTISDPARFFSHRRDARTGRMATLVWRE